VRTLIIIIIIIIIKNTHLAEQSGGAPCARLGVVGVGPSTTVDSGGGGGGGSEDDVLRGPGDSTPESAWSSTSVRVLVPTKTHQTPLS